MSFLRLRQSGRLHTKILDYMRIRAISSEPPRITYQVPLTGVIVVGGVVGTFVYANYKYTQFKNQCTQWINTTRDAATGTWNAVAERVNSGKSKLGAIEIKRPSIEAPQSLKDASQSVWNAAAKGLESGKSKLETTEVKIETPQSLKDASTNVRNAAGDGLKLLKSKAAEIKSKFRTPVSQSEPSIPGEGLSPKKKE